MKRWFCRLIFSWLCLVVSGCGNGSSTPSAAPPSSQLVNNPMDPATISATPSRTVLGTVGDAKVTTITVFVADGEVPPQPVNGALVTFSTTGGSLSATGATTDPLGHASVTFTSAATPGTIMVSAAVSTGSVAEGKISATATVPVVDVTSVSLVTNQASIENDNRAAGTLTATVAMPAGVSAQGIPVAFTVTGSGNLSATTVTTDAGGQAAVTLTSGAVGTVNVTAWANGKSSPAVPVVVTPKPTQAIVKVSTTGSLPSGHLIQALDGRMQSPPGVTVQTDPGGAIDPRAVALSSVTTGSTLVDSFINQVAAVTVINATGVGTGDMYTLTYDIAGATPTPAASDFAWTMQTVGDTGGAFPLMGLTFTVSFQ